MIDFTLFPSPCYIMEEELLRKNLTLIKSVADRAGVEIILAFKSFAMWRSFPIFREYIEHSTASSVYEARLALEEFGSKAHTYSPAYTEADFPEIMRCSSHITFNSLSQFHRFYPMVEAEGSGISCGIRVNPEYSEVETELYNPCAPGTRFGVMAEQLPDRLPQGIEGFPLPLPLRIVVLRAGAHAGAPGREVCPLVPPAEVVQSGRWSLDDPQGLRRGAPHRLATGP